MEIMSIRYFFFFSFVYKVKSGNFREEKSKSVLNFFKVSRLCEHIIALIKKGYYSVSNFKDFPFRAGKKRMQ